MTPLHHQQDPNDTKRMIAVMAFAFAVLFLWQFYFLPNESTQEQQQASEASATVKGIGLPVGQVDALAEGGSGLENLIVLSREEALAQSPRVPIDTPALTGSINLKGGLLDDLSLKTYFQTIDEGSDIVHLFSPLGAPIPYFFDYTLRAHEGVDLDIPGADSLWTLHKGDVLRPDSPVTLAYEAGAGVSFFLTYSIDSNYLVSADLRVENQSDKEFVLYPRGRVRLVHLNREGGLQSSNLGYVIHEGMIGDFDEDPGLIETGFADLKEDKTLISKVNDAWLGITSVYWAAIMLPTGDVGVRMANVGSEEEPVYLAEYLGLDPVKVGAGQSASVSTNLFAGAKEVALVDKYSEELNRPSIELIIDWGYLYYLTRTMFYLLDIIYGYVGNFGLAILVVTVLVKLIFFPIANKSYVSMTMMKKLQPKIKSLQSQHQDDKVKLQQEIMALYKKEKVNPLAGCLPMLLQIPVFFSLYKVIYVSIEMRQKPFFGWIQDLSVSDPTNLFTLFGLIPFDLPAFLHIGIWPLIMGVTMFLQMKMNPPPPDPVQAKVFTLMPIFFTFILASFPAGLVIYWSWNNTLSILQQGFIMRRLGVKIELFDNLRSMVKRKKKTDQA